MSFASSNAAARKKPEIGNPNREEEPGRPDDKLSDRGFGTELRTDPVFLGPAEDALCSIRYHVAPRHQRSSGRLSRQRLHGVSRYLRQ